MKGGHSKIMEAVDNFKRENGEHLRFEKLVTAFMDQTSSSDFQVVLLCWLHSEITFFIHFESDLLPLALSPFRLLS